MIELSPAQRRDFKARAHHLHPVVSIAGNGLTPAVLQEIDTALQAHELIKVRVYGADRTVRTGYATEICQILRAASVQMIGNLLVIWRPREERETTKAAPAPAEEKTRAGAATLKSAKAFAQAARRRALAAAAASKLRAAAKTRKPAPRGGPAATERKRSPR